MTNTLTSDSTLQCPHGGSVSITTSNSSVNAGGSAVLTISDTFTVSGCAFTLPGPKPSPCIRVQWIVPDFMCKLGGIPTLSRSSVGLCFSADSIPQGPPTVVHSQMVVSST